MLCFIFFHNSRYGSFEVKMSEGQPYCIVLHVKASLMKTVSGVWTSGSSRKIDLPLSKKLAGPPCGQKYFFTKSK